MPKAEQKIVDSFAAGRDLGLRAVLADTVKATGGTNYVDLAGMDDRVCFEMANGPVTAAAVKFQGALDPADGTDFDDTTATWTDLDVLPGGMAGTAAATAIALSASQTKFAFIDPRYVPRYVRANITTANTTDGTTIQVYAEG